MQFFLCCISLIPYKAFVLSLSVPYFFFFQRLGMVVRRNCCNFLVSLLIAFESS